MLTTRRRLESRFSDNIKSHIKAGTAKSRIRTYFAYLTRLRQAIAHPFLLEGALSENFTLEDFRWLRNQLKKHGGKTPLHQQIGRWVDTEFESRDDSGEFGEGRFGQEFDMNSQLEDAERSKTTAGLLCRLCYEIPQQASITEVCDAN